MTQEESTKLKDDEVYFARAANQSWKIIEQLENATIQLEHEFPSIHEARVEQEKLLASSQSENLELRERLRQLETMEAELAVDVRRESKALSAEERAFTQRCQSSTSRANE